MAVLNKKIRPRPGRGNSIAQPSQSPERYQQFMKSPKEIRYEEQHERDIANAISKFSQHFMSNSKWVRLIDKLVENVRKVKKVKFKKVQSEQIGELYLNDETTFGFDYWQNGFEGHNSLGGWLTYKEIEYLIFPKLVDKDAELMQDLDQVLEVINSVSKFELEVCEEHIKLICYRK